MNLLIVDDEPQLRKLLREYFEHLGWAVTCAGSGDEAIRILEHSAFDVVLSDVWMPGASGLDVVRTVRRECPHTQVVLMTGYRNLKSAIDAVNQGAFAYVEKPFNLHDIHARVQDALDAKQRSEGDEEHRLSLESLVGQQEEELSLLKERSRTILGVIPAMLLLVDEDARVQDANAPFLLTFDSSRAELLGASLCDGVRCPQSQGGSCSAPCETWTGLQSTISSGRPSDRFIVIPPFGRSPHAERPSFQIRILALPCLDASGNSRREFLVLMEDISRERAMEMQVLHSSRLASLGEMASGIVHELSQPLNAISVQTQLLKFKVDQGTEVSQEAIRSSAQEILDQVFRVSEVLGHLRLYGCHEFISTAAEFSPEDVVEGSLKLIHTQLRTWGISLVVRPTGPLLPLRGKLHDLQHAVTNVLLNARDALRVRDRREDPDGERDARGAKEIRISLGSFQRDGQAWGSIVVEDNGIGMTPSVLERSFDPLFTTKLMGEGTGLGLPIAASILREHGGQISIQSEPRRGTAVRIEIPACPSTDPPEPAR
jgi:two-component system, cell cycle sensor histidine kinase and response regulator CckA